MRRLRSDRDLEHCLLRNSSLLQWLHQNETYTSLKTGRTIRPENKSKHYYVFKFKSSENTQFYKIDSRLMMPVNQVNLIESENAALLSLF